MPAPKGLMAYIRQRITIISINRPSQKNINQELQWLGSSLGLFNIRDKDKSCFRVFLELLKSAKAGDLMSSDDIANKLSLTRGTVIHHINRLIESGLVVHEGNTYYLRADNLRALIDELEKDVKRTWEDLRDIAKEIDGQLDNRNI